jgi:hypothetical protein
MRLFYNDVVHAAGNWPAVYKEWESGLHAAARDSVQRALQSLQQTGLHAASAGARGPPPRLPQQQPQRRPLWIDRRSNAEFDALKQHPSEELRYWQKQMLPASAYANDPVNPI